MSTVLDVLRFVVIDNRSLYPRETCAGTIVQPYAFTDAHTRLWRSTRSLMEQLERETNSKTNEELTNHFDHTLSKRAELIFDMMKDHARHAGATRTPPQ